MKLSAGQLSLWLLSTVGCGASVAEDQLLELSLSELTATAGGASRGRLADIKRALREVGGLAVTGLRRPDYSSAVQRLREVAPNCLRANTVGDDAENHMPVRQVELEDRGRRLSLVRMEDPEDKSTDEWPDCLRAEMAAVTSTFDQVEQELVAALGRLLGNQTLLVATPAAADGSLAIRKLSDLAAKTHVHVYDNNIIGGGEVGNGEDTEILSLPYHVDNGLYLLLTPSPIRPLRLRSRSGQTVRTDTTNDDDAVIFLLGRGVTDWLLQGNTNDEKELGRGRYRHLVPALHAVPSLRGTPPTTTRTVVARMRVAPLNAMPATSLLLGLNGSPQQSSPPRHFGDIFFDGAVRQSATSLCYFGGPLSRAEAGQRSRRHTADCWPHTQKC